MCYLSCSRSNSSGTSMTMIEIDTINSPTVTSEIGKVKSKELED